MAYKNHFILHSFCELSIQEGFGRVVLVRKSPLDSTPFVAGTAPADVEGNTATGNQQSLFLHEVSRLGHVTLLQLDQSDLSHSVAATR